LRIQSFGFTSRSESTRTHTHHSAHRCAHNEVYSLLNVTAKVSFQEPKSLPVPQAFAAHVSLSSHLQLSKNRPLSAVTKPNPQTLKPGKQTSKSANPLDFSRTKQFVASSAAALVQ